MKEFVELVERIVGGPLAGWENHPRGREVLDEFANTTSGKLAAA